MPLVNLILWFAGVQVFVEQMITLGGYAVLIDQLMTYGLVVLLIMLVTLAWVIWNSRHYGRHNVRTHELAALTLAETADVAGLEVSVVEQLQYSARITLAFDEHNHLLPLEVDALWPRNSAP